MPTTPLLPLPEGLEIIAVSTTDLGLQIRVISHRDSSRCPRCSEPSQAIHSDYRRKPLELPCAGQLVRLDRLLTVSPEVQAIHTLVQSFLEMVRQRKGKDLRVWMEQASSSGIAEMKSFVTGLERDYDAVKAGLSQEWSQGPVEGAVNKIKTHKRLMYGRASFPLLRKKMLHQVGSP